MCFYSSCYLISQTPRLRYEFFCSLITRRSGCLKHIMSHAQLHTYKITRKEAGFKYIKMINVSAALAEIVSVGAARFFYCRQNILRYAIYGAAIFR